MKIAIACHPTYGGSGVVAAELGMALAQRGHEVHFVSYQTPFRVQQRHDNVFFHEVEVTSYPLFRYPPYALALSTKLLDVVRSNGVQMLHVHYAIPHSISGILTRQMCAGCDVRVVTTLHGTDITLVGSDPSFLEITRFGIDESDGVTAVSEYLAAETQRSLGVTRDIEVIPNFVDPEIYSSGASPQLRQRFASPDEKLLVHVSNFRPVKRVLDVVRCFARVEGDVPSRLLCVGTGPELAVAEEEASRLGVRDKVCFMGAADGVQELLACADVFLLPSESEAFGLAALEAMSCGVPVVATRSGGIPEVVIHGETGFLTEVGDVEAMAAACIRILRAPEMQQSMGRASRQRVIEEFPLTQVVDAYEQYYERVLAQPSR